MMTNQKNILINVLLGLVAIVFVVLTYLAYQSWQRSTPPPYTASSSADQSKYLVQLKDHLNEALFKEIEHSVQENLAQDVNHLTIREGTYQQKANAISFLTDLSQSSATYRFQLNTDDNSVNVICPASNEKRDSAWVCGLDPTGDQHVH